MPKLNTYISKNYSAKILLFSLIFSLILLPALTAQDNANTQNSAQVAPRARMEPRNSWEELYLRIAENLSPESVWELLQSMSLEENQASLVSSYYYILKDQAWTLFANEKKNYLYSDNNLNFLLDKLITLSDSLKTSDPDAASFIKLNLVPKLGLNENLGKTFQLLAKLGETDLLPLSLLQMEHIHILAKTAPSQQFDLLNYAIENYIKATGIYADVQAYPTLFYIAYTSTPSFNQQIRNKAIDVMKSLVDSDASGTYDYFYNNMMEDRSLFDLEVINSYLQDYPEAMPEEQMVRYNLGLIKRMNNFSWENREDFEAVRHDIFRESLIRAFAKADKLPEDASQTIITTYKTANNVNVKYLAVQLLGILDTKEGNQLLLDEVSQLNSLMRQDSLSSDEQSLVRQTLYALSLGKNSSPSKTKVLRDVMFTPYPDFIRNQARKIMQDLS